MMCEGLLGLRGRVDNTAWSGHVPALHGPGPLHCLCGILALVLALEGWPSGLRRWFAKPV